MTDLGVVGAGHFELTVAEQVASRWGARVLLVDSRDHLGGDSHSAPDQAAGTEVHTYGSHIFHTSNDRVWNNVNRFTAFNRYVHRAQSVHGEEAFPWPVNRSTLELVLGHRAADAFLQETANRAGQKSRSSPNFEEAPMARFGRTICEALIRGYTLK